MDNNQNLDYGYKIRRYDLTMKGIYIAVSLVMAIVIAIISKLISVFVNKKPEILLNYFTNASMIIVAVVIAVIIIGLSVLAVIKLSKIMKGSKILPIIIASILVGISCVCFVATAVNEITDFSDTVGVVSVSNYNELQNLKRHPNLSYSLDSNITVKKNESEWKTINNFTGTLEGNGHTISGLSFGDSGFIETNNGTINNLKLKGVKYKENNKYGDFGVLVLKNYGTVTKCELVNGSKKKARKLIALNCGVSKSNKGKIFNSCKDKEHEFEKTATVKATLAQKGYSVYKCKICGYKYTSVDIFMLYQKIFVLAILMVVCILITLYSFGNYKLRAKHLVIPAIILIILSILLGFYGDHAKNQGTGHTAFDNTFVSESFEENKPTKSKSTICKKEKAHKFTRFYIKSLGSTTKKAKVVYSCAICAKTKTQRKDLSNLYIGIMAAFTLVCFLSLLIVLKKRTINAVYFIDAFVLLILGLLLAMFLRQRCYSIESKPAIIALMTLIQVASGGLICGLMSKAYDKINNDASAGLVYTLVLLAIGHSLSALIFPSLYQWHMWIVSLIYIIAMIVARFGVKEIRDEVSLKIPIYVGSAVSLASIVANIISLVSNK